MSQRDPSPETSANTALAVAPDGKADRAKAAAYGAAVGTLGAVPLVGGVLAGIAGSFIPNAKLDRATRFVNDLAERLRAAEGQIDEEFVRRDEFAATVEDVLDRVTRRKNDAKIRYFAAALAASATHTRPSSRERDRFVDLLDDLRPSHLSVLAGIARGTPPPAARYPFTVGTAASDAIAAATAGSESDDVAQDMHDLEVRGLLRSKGDGITSLHVASDIRALMTPLGLRFIEFVSPAARARPERKTNGVTRTRKAEPSR
ncbi:MAG: hypothetical protein ABSD62_11945 [Candidatus Limnocylindrales bacterium]|jgi:hypothetical protein